MTKKQQAETSVLDTSPQSPSRLSSDSPAREVHLITTEVKKEVWEHCADLFEQAAHKLIGAVQDGVDGPIGPRRTLAQIAGSQEAWSTWVVTNTDSEEQTRVGISPSGALHVLLSLVQPRACQETEGLAGLLPDPGASTRTLCKRHNHCSSTSAAKELLLTLRKNLLGSSVHPLRLGSVPGQR